MNVILSLTTFLPLVGVALILLMARGAHGDMLTRQIALFTTLVTFLCSLYAWSEFDSSVKAFQLVENYAWLGGTIRYHLGVDGISLPFVILTAFLMPLCILASWTSIETRIKE
jgi:NADH-quinone oxidoreductase subunit M